VLFAQTPTLYLSPEQQQYSLWQHLSFMEDNDGNLTIDDVALSRTAQNFIPVSGETFSASFRSSVYWGRFVVADTFQMNQIWLLASQNFNARRIDVYVQHDSDQHPHFHHLVLGNTIPVFDKEIPWYGSAFRIPLHGKEPSVVFIRMESNYFTFTFELLSARNFIWFLIKEHLLYGLFYGGMLMLIIYNIALWLGLKERIYLVCVLYAGFAVMATMTQDGFLYEWLPTIAQYRTWIVHGAFGFLMALLALFTAEFLHTKTTSPPTHQFLKFVALANLIRIVITPFLPSTFASLLLNAFDIVSSLVVAGIALWRWRTVTTPDRIFAFATLFFVLCLITYLVNVLGIIEENTFIRRYMLHIGFILQTGLFSLVASIKVSDLRLAKTSAEAQAENTDLYRRKNEELANANSEILRQQELVMEQAKEIEIANTQLQEQNVKLSKLNSQKDDFLGMAAHDLKNPLMSIRDLAQAIEAGGLNSTDTREFAGLIHTSADRMFALIKDLLNTNAIEQGGIKVAQELFDMNMLMQNIIATYSRQAEAKSISIRFTQDPPGQAIFCFADPSLTLQVMDNIVSNAIKYSPAGKNVLIRVIRQPIRFVRVEVQDEGQGLTEEDKRKLFGRFTKLSARPTAGEHSTGLGLSIAKNLVELMNGRIWCESEVDNGATFIVELPSRAV
jgi:signal transduction histidine kinase